jgi:hypothetical protein
VWAVANSGAKAMLKFEATGMADFLVKVPFNRIIIYIYNINDI